MITSTAPLATAIEERPSMDEEELVTWKEAVRRMRESVAGERYGPEHCIQLKDLIAPQYDFMAMHIVSEL